jgi:uncharacterized protein DUF1302
MSDRRARLALLGGLVALLTIAGPNRAGATIKYGPFQLSGSLQSQNLIRHPDVDSYNITQQRNTARLQLEYKWLENGKFIDKYDIPFIARSSLYVLYRGVYDSFYDFTPGYIEKSDVHGKVYNGQDLFDFAKVKGNALGRPKFARNTLTVSGMTHEERDALKFDNQLREAYVDLKMRDIPLSVRAGRQQIVWGETDNFRMLDRVNPLDLTWHFFFEFPAPAFGWDQIRRPMWMLKFLYDLGDIGKLSQNYLEWYWNPGDWYPAKQAFMPQPWGLRFLDPLTNPVDGAFIGGVCAIAPGGKCKELMNGTKLFKQGNYDKNVYDNNQVGVRYHAMTPQGVEFTLNYFYQRWSGDDGTNYAPLRGLEDNTQNRALASQLLQQGIFPAEFIAPYVHTPGMSANYSDEQFTQTVYRMEMIYDIGIPMFDVAKQTVIDSPVLPGVTKKDMWKGMIAFDRPTWIRAVNKKTTVFLTGQFFWHYVVDNPDCEPQTVARAGANFKRKTGSCLIGGLDLPSTVRVGNTKETEAYRDKIRDWESIFTLAAFTFYRGGSIIPLVGMAVDWVNQWNMLPFWMVDYVVRDDFVINLSQRYIVTPRGHSTPIFSTWGLGSLNSGRSETNIRLTYQF